jgi:hypothetical protein
MTSANEHNHGVVRVKKYNPGMDGNEVVEDRAVVQAVATLKEIKLAQADLDAAAQTAKDAITEFHFRTGIREFDVDGLGSVTAYLGSSTRFDKSKAALHLVEAGVSAEVVEKAWNVATKTEFNKAVTVRFTPAK